MRLDLTAVVWKEKDWFVSRCVEIEVASQGKTEDEAMSNLQEVVLLYLQDDDTGEIQNPASLRKVLPLTVSG